MRSKLLSICLLVSGMAGTGSAQDAMTASPRPAVELVVMPGEASATPLKKGIAYVNGGVIDVAQPNPTTIVVTMTGLTAVNADLLCSSVANYQFDLVQCFKVAVNSKRVQASHLTLEGRVIGLLRSDHSHHAGCCFHHLCKKCGTAEAMPATAAISCGSQPLVSLTLPARTASDCQDLSIYNHEGPLETMVPAGTFTLHANWGFGVTHPAFHTRGASAEFAPQPSYVPESYWFSEFRPFNGLATRDFGYQVIIKVVPEFKPTEKDVTDDKR